MAARGAEVAVVTAIAAILTAVIAAPVLRAPSERMFGMEIVGRHYDPFSVMEQFESPIGQGIQAQPVTDLTGAALARVAGPVAAYNWLILLSFPLAAAAAYLLARFLALSPLAATAVALAYAFSPFHLAQSAYHPHIAQIQWIPLYFLALWNCLERSSPAAVGLLIMATLAVTFSNFYGGLIAGVTTPVAVAAYWLSTRRQNPQSTRRLLVTLATLLCIAGAAAVYLTGTNGTAIEDSAALAFPRGDLFRYSAKWWSYLVPPVAQPLLGHTVRRLWEAAGVRDGLLEQQVFLGWAVVILAAAAIVHWCVWIRRTGVRSYVPALTAIAATALLCSLSPERTIGGVTFRRPSALLYDVVPMFRSYARFGVVVQLMTVLLAGVGADVLRRSRTRSGQVALVGLVALGIGEYAVSPGASWRDVLPTRAHRWVMRQAEPATAFDCAPFSQESESVQWLTGNRITMGDAASDCTEPNLPQRLAATGFTYLLVRRGTADGQWLGARARNVTWPVAAGFDDAQVLAVTAPRPDVYTGAMGGFFPRE
ncbi:MAG: hypothetical protein ABI652_07835, partial [Acidobacteriota bacterium]